MTYCIFVGPESNLGFIDEAYDDVLCLNGCDYFKATPISLNFGERANNIDFSLSSMLLRDDFQDDVVTWNVKSGIWTELGNFLNGSLDQKNNKALVFAPFPWNPSGANGCTRCTVETATNTSGGPGSKVVMHAWHQNSANRVELSIKEDVDRWKLKHIVNGSVVASERKTLPIEPGVNYRIKLRYDGTQFQVWVDDELLMSMPCSNIPFGSAGFEIKKTSASFDYILIY